MKRMQTVWLERFEKEVESRGLTPINNGAWANTGRLYVMNGTKAEIVLSYSFQDAYASINEKGDDARREFSYIEYHKQERVDEFWSWLTSKLDKIKVAA